MDITGDLNIRTLGVHQSIYAQEVIERFGLSFACGPLTSMDSNINILQISAKPFEPYRASVVSLMYFMVSTGLELAYANCPLAKHVEKR